jgi:hypothetical protein
VVTSLQFWIIGEVCESGRVWNGSLCTIPQTHLDTPITLKKK